MSDGNATALNQLLETERTRREWSIGRMAKECGLPPSTLYTVLSRPQYVPRVETLRKLAKGLSIPLSQLTTAAGLSVDEATRQEVGSEADLILLVIGWARLGEAQRAELVALCRQLLGDKAPPDL